MALRSSVSALASLRTRCFLLVVEARGRQQPVHRRQQVVELLLLIVELPAHRLAHVADGDQPLIGVLFQRLHLGAVQEPRSLAQLLQTFQRRADRAEHVVAAEAQRHHELRLLEPVDDLLGVARLGLHLLELLHGHLVPGDHAAVGIRHKVLVVADFGPLEVALGLFIDAGGPERDVDEHLQLDELFLGQFGVLHLEADDQVGHADQRRVLRQRRQRRPALDCGGVHAGRLAGRHRTEERVTPGGVDDLEQLHEIDEALVAVNEDFVGGHLRR